MEKCNKCEELTGLRFERQYSPVQYFHGKKNSKVLVIGLNPSGKIGDNNTTETIDNLSDFLPDNSYFKDFANVSKKIYDNFGKENGVIHTDLVKCFSPKFPPVKLNISDLDRIICNCRVYLMEQIKIFEPKIIICNGSHVVYHIQQIIPVKEGLDFDTYYIGKFVNDPFVIRTGFIGRLDNYAKKRLGKEIEKILNEFNLLN